MKRVSTAAVATLIVACAIGACAGDNMGHSNITTLMKQDVKVGTGAEATPGRRVQVHYTGWLYDEGRADHKGRSSTARAIETIPSPFASAEVKSFPVGIKVSRECALAASAR